MQKVRLKVGGMSCSACSSSLQKYLNKQAGIIDASVNLVLQEAFITYEDSLQISEIEQFIEDAGYESLGLASLAENKKENIKNKLLFYGVLALLALYIAMGHMVGLPSIPVLDMHKNPIGYSISLFILVLFFLYFGRDILKKGIKQLLNKAPNMDTLVTIGVLASFLFSTYNMIFIFLGHNDYVSHLYFESITTIIFFIKLGRVIDSKSKEKTKEAIKELVEITPQNALVKKGDKEVTVTIDEIRVGDTLICKPGSKIAVDGVITSGSAHIDEAFITGEAIPVKKKKSDKVVAGSINLDGYLEYRAEKIGKDSTISAIVHLVIEAANTKSAMARLADKVSLYFVPSILLIAILTFLGYLLLGHSFNEALISCVTVLVVSCPCALGLATPLAIVISEGVCAKSGILVKSSEIFESAHKIDTIVFDKTGTLTYGNLSIAKIINASTYSDEELITLTTSLEEKSTHPIAIAFQEYVKNAKLEKEEVTSFKNMAGIGVTGTIHQKKIYVGNNKLFTKLKVDNPLEQDELNLSTQGYSIVYVLEDKKVLGLFGVKDVVRENAKQTVLNLQKLGIEVVMLTGDNEKTATKVAQEIGIKKVIANVLPNEKTNYIKELLQNRKQVMMVGDGINDAPALATASIGVSMTSGTDIAGDSSDIILMQNDLERILSLLTISKRTVRNIKQNLFWAFFYNICMIPLAIGLLKPFGFSMNPMFAGIAMTISSITVLLNALRLNIDSQNNLSRKRHF